MLRNLKTGVLYRNPSGQETRPNQNSFPPRELRHTQNRLLSRSFPLTLVGPGNMVKFSISPSNVP